jgi:hypothetical protein
MAVILQNGEAPSECTANGASSANDFMSTGYACGPTAAPITISISVGEIADPIGTTNDPAPAGAAFVIDPAVPADR